MEDKKNQENALTVLKIQLNNRRKILKYFFLMIKMGHMNFLNKLN